MTGKIEARLTELSVELSKASAPAGNYAPWVRTGDLVFVSGQVSRDKDGLMTGRLGDGASLEHGQAAARACAVSLLSVLKEACDGDLDRVQRVVKLTGFVFASPGFTEHPKVINGASDLMADVFGEAGRHARAAVGCASLPFNVSVEVEGVFQIS